MESTIAMDQIRMKNQQQFQMDGASFRPNGTIPCKLPLLDGDTNTTAHVITTEVEPENSADFQEIYSKDREDFEILLCATWGLLLRCYTGQEAVSFHFQGCCNKAFRVGSATAEQKHTVTVEMQEMETLASYVEKTQTRHTMLTNEESRSEFSKLNNRSIATSTDINTTIQIQNDDSLDPFAKSFARNAEAHKTGSDGAKTVSISERFGNFSMIYRLDKI